jgi:broad specificity phosphatase PhoE
MRHRLAFALALSIALTAGLHAGGGDPPPGPVAFLVRHAEKDLAGGADPGLTAEGAARAQRLADLLAGEGIARVLVTDTRRARDTGGPLATRQGLQVELYDPRALAELAAALKKRGETVLVVGHSNTTDVLARLLGGEPGPPIDEATEFDRLYRVDLGSGATERRRY